MPIDILITLSTLRNQWADFVYVNAIFFQETGNYFKMHFRIVYRIVYRIVNFLAVNNRLREHSSLSEVIPWTNRKNKHGRSRWWVLSENLQSF